MGSSRHEAPSYATASRDGAVVVVRRDGARATVVDLADGLVRVRILALCDGRWVSISDATLDVDRDVCTPLDPDDPPLALLEAA